MHVHAVYLAVKQQLKQLQAFATHAAPGDDGCWVHRFVYRFFPQGVPFTDMD